MKFMHLADLHLGKRVNGFSMLEDQEYILKKILQIVDEEQPDAVLIAGDVYDKSMPSAEAVVLLDDFLCRLAKRKLQVLLIAGNHDSAERLAFGGRLLSESGVHLSPVYDGTVSCVTLTDAFGPMHFWLLPFVKPVHVRAFLPEEAAKIETYTDALAAAIEGMHADFEERNVLVCHQFVTGAGRSESEELSVGGTDNVDGIVFDGFDYVALGHLHGPQNVGTERIRYCGTPLKYSFSEKDHIKSVSVVTLGEKGSLEVRAVPLAPLRDLREVKGSYDEVVYRGNQEGQLRDDYMHVILTDEEDVPDALQKLRTVYPNLMKLDYDNTRTRTAAFFDEGAERENKSEIELLDEFYEKQNGISLNDAQRKYSLSLLEKIKEELA